MSEKEPKFKVGQRVRCEWLGFEGEVEVVAPVRGGFYYGVSGNPRCPEHYRTMLEESRLEAVEEKPSLVEADFFEFQQRIEAFYSMVAHAAISQIIDGFNKLRADIEDDSEEDNMVEPAVEAMSLMDGLRSSLHSILIRAKAMNLAGSGVSTSINEAFEQLNDLTDAVDELIEQRDAARAEGPEYEFTEEGRTIAPLFVPPGSVATWLFGMGMIETVTGHVDGKKCFEFGVSETPAAPGDVLTGARSREPRIRMVFHDDEAIHRLIADLVLLANGDVRRRANDAE